MPPPKTSSRRIRIYLLTALILYCVGGYFIFITPPREFPRESIITIPSGSGLMTLSRRLEEEKVIRSALVFRVVAILLGNEKGMQAGQYYLDKPENVFTLARRVERGEYRIKTNKVTIPEGFNVKKIAALFGDEYIFFDNEAFASSAQEGYLFPDTYFIPITATASSTAQLLRDNFMKKVSPLMPQVEESERSLEEVITMASIIESEAKTKEDREIISGILWRRLDQGVPLQVDASFSYVNGKTTAELTLDDLKIKSPYNTYLYAGLPPTPITNPGLESIKAALSPTTTTYMYFLTGKDGKMYYARTFDEHVRNKQKYLYN